MQIAKELAGFSGAKADDLRKAIGKKNRAAMADARSRSSVAGCAGIGDDAGRSIDWLWATNEKSADYSFNKSHAACYALIAYRTAWLKANYCAEYMAALISSVMDTKDKVPFFVARCEEMGIEILPPDVNLSDHEFVVVDGNIRFGLDAVKGVGYAAVEAIKRAREEGGAVHVAVGLLRARRPPRRQQEGDRGADQVRRASARRAPARKGMLAVLEQAQSAGQKAQQDAEIGQGSIFDLGAGAGAPDGAAPPFAGAVASADPGRGVRAGRAAGASRRNRSGLFISAAPAQGGPRGAAREGRLLAGGARAAARTANGSPSGGIITAGQEDPHARRAIR